MRTRDTQKQRCYNWEREVGCREVTPTNLLLNKDQAQRVVDHVWSRYSRVASSPRVHLSGTRRGSYDPYRHRVNLPKNTRLALVLHEVGHAIAGSREGWHGPAFVRLLFDLYERYLKVDRATLRGSAKKHRVRVATVAQGPRQVKRHTRIQPKALYLSEKGTVTVMAKKETAVHELLPKGISGSVARVEGTKVIGVHKVVDGQSLCGNDVTVISPNLAAHKGYWKRTTEAVSCGRCLKGDAKPAAATKVAAKKGTAAKATRKSAGRKPAAKRTSKRVAATRARRK